MINNSSTRAIALRHSEATEMWSLGILKRTCLLRPCSIGAVLGLLACLLVARANADLPILTAKTSSAVMDEQSEGLKIWSAKKPILIDIAFDQAEGLPSLNSDEVDRLTEALLRNAKRLVTIDFDNAAIRFKSFDRKTRKRLLERGGPGIADAYDRHMAATITDFLDRVRERVPSAAIAIRGVPFEDRDGSARATNDRYAKVIERLDGFVSSSSILANRTSEESNLIQRVLSESLRLSNARPIIYRANGDWRMVWSGNLPSSDAGELDSQVGMLEDYFEAESAANRPTRSSTNHWRRSRAICDLGLQNNH